MCTFSVHQIIILFYISNKRKLNILFLNLIFMTDFWKSKHVNFASREEWFCWYIWFCSKLEALYYFYLIYLHKSSLIIGNLLSRAISDCIYAKYAAVTQDKKSRNLSPCYQNYIYLPCLYTLVIRGNEFNVDVRGWLIAKPIVFMISFILFSIFE